MFLRFDAGQNIGSYGIKLTNQKVQKQEAGGVELPKLKPVAQTNNSANTADISTTNYLEQLENMSSKGNDTTNTSYKDLEQALNDYVKNFRAQTPNFDTIQERVDYYLEYNNTCIDYYNRMMNAPEATDEDKAYCQRMINLHNRDKNNQLVDLNNYAKENGIKTESFEDVYNEFIANVPDRTTTESEKELAISYINRMLSCDDIPDRLKTYWTFKKNTIQTELLGLKQANNSNATYKDLEQALNDYVKNFRAQTPNFDTIQERVDYYLEYNNTCIDYYNQMMNAPEATDEDKAYCQRMINLHNRDKNNQLVDLNNYAKENGIKTESFEDVYNEFIANVPDRTTTESEKELAISYINRMLSCDDIPDRLKTYWTDKKSDIESELKQINTNPFSNR